MSLYEMQNSNLGYEPSVFPAPKRKRNCYVVYLSGPMKGMPDNNFPLFNTTAKKWREAGWAIINPAENFGGEACLLTRTQRLKQDYVSLITSCNAIALLPDWEKSEGAMVEYMIALSLGYEIFDAVHVGIPLSTIKAQHYNVEGKTISNTEWCKMQNQLEQAGVAQKQNTPIGDAIAYVRGEIKTESCCATAEKLVTGERREDYGHPLDDFSKVVGMANSLGWRIKEGDDDFRPLKSEDHAIYMQLVKISREAHRHKRDNLIDGCGYWKTLDLIHDMK